MFQNFKNSGIQPTYVEVYKYGTCRHKTFLNRPNVRGLELDIILKGTLSLWDGSTILIGLYISSHSSPSSYLRRDRKFQLLKWTPIHHPLANKLTNHGLEINHFLTDQLITDASYSHMHIVTMKFNINYLWYIIDSF